MKMIMKDLAPKVMITKGWYIIKVINSKKHKTYYKIGEGRTESRPDDLVNKYNRLRANKATKLIYEELPYSKSKGTRLNDKLIHKNLDATILKASNPYEIQVELNEKDGKDEFFEAVNPMTDDEIIKYIESIINRIKVADYRAKILYDTLLVYNPETYHLVNATFINIILEQYPEIKNALYNNIGENILLIGQFEPVFVNTLAMYNDIYIWHDAKKNKHEYILKVVDERIHYIDNLKELLDMNIKFKTVIENTPYGKFGAIINDTVRAEVDWEYCISLLPIKDMPDAGLEACNYLDMSRTRALPPHTFKDADILTHILVFKKEKQNDYKSFKEVVADSFVVDKPFLKFMKANELASHYAIDDIKMYVIANDVNSSFIFQLLRILSQHTCGLDRLDSETVATEYNFKDNIIDKPTATIKNPIITAAGNSNYKVIQFKTASEKQHLVEFYKKYRNFLNRMIVNQFISIRDSGACFPKVDWTKSGWTPETVMKDITKRAGNEMTDEEIKAVMDTMDKDYEVSNDDDLNRLFGEYLNEIR